MGPYALPTGKASKKLADLMRQPGNEWWTPSPLDRKEQGSFEDFLKRHGVELIPKAPLFGEWEADRDLCPYVFAWRYMHGELTFTALGRAQYAAKKPFSSVGLR